MVTRKKVFKVAGLMATYTIVLWVVGTLLNVVGGNPGIWDAYLPRIDPHPYLFVVVGAIIVCLGPFVSLLMVLPAMVAEEIKERKLNEGQKGKVNLDGGMEKIKEIVRMAVYTSVWWIVVILLFGMMVWSKYYSPPAPRIPLLPVFFLAIEILLLLLGALVAFLKVFPEMVADEIVERNPGKGA